jgi:hypothetical protein
MKINKPSRLEQTKEFIEGCGKLAMIGTFASVVYIVDRTYYNLLHLYFHATKTEHFGFKHPYTGFKTYERGPKSLDNKF